MGIRSLKGRIARDIWTTGKSRVLPEALWKRARFLMIVMNASTRLENLKIDGSPPDIRLHKLSGNLKGKWSVTIHKASGWRIVFAFKGGESHDVEIVNYHRG